MVVCKEHCIVTLEELSEDIKGRLLTEMNKPYRFIKATRLYHGVPLG